MKNILLIGIFIAISISSYLIGLTVGEIKVYNILYRVEHLEKRLGNIDVIDKNRTSGFYEAIIRSK